METPNVVVRALGAVATGLGLFLIISIFAWDYPSKTQGVDDLTDAFRSSFTDDALAQTRADMDVINAFVAEFQADAAPELAAALTEAGAIGSPDQFGPFVNENFPDLAAGLAQFDEPILPFFNGVVDGLEANQTAFERSDSIPTSWLPATAVHWIFLLLGLLITALGAAAAATGRMRMVQSLGIVGVAIVVVVFALRIPMKTQAVDDLTDSFRPVFSDEGAATAREHFTTTALAGADLNNALPAIADALGTPTEQLVADLSANHPDVGTGLAELPEVLERFDGLVTAVEGNVDSFALADSIPTASTKTTRFTWHLLAPGLILVTLGAIGTLLGRRAKDGDSEGIARPQSPERGPVEHRETV